MKPFPFLRLKLFPANISRGSPGRELRCCHSGGECSKGKDWVSCAWRLFKKAILSRKGMGIWEFSSSTWARGWMSRRASGCRRKCRLPHSAPRLCFLASRLCLEMNVSHQSWIWGKDRISQDKFHIIFQVCISLLKADGLEEKSFLIDSQ